jgi:hypothetical protein
MTQTKVEAPFVEGGGGSSFKNLVINGGQKIAQRATAATAVSNGSYQTVDRWKLYNVSDGAYTTAQTALSLTDQATTDGQTHALDIQCTTADGSVGAGQYAFIYHLVEAQNCQHLKFGTSSAVDLTLQFYVKSNLTGTTCGFIAKEDSTYCQAPFEFTINSANTWEKKVVTIPANAVIQASSSIINNDNGAGIGIGFNLLLGGNFDNGTNLTWETGGASYATTNVLNFLSSTDNDFFITGLQLEVGNDASDFEHLPIDVELQRCRRYLQRVEASGTDYGSFGSGANANTASSLTQHLFSPPMRTVPTLHTTGTAANYSVFNGSTGLDACASIPAINGNGGTNSQIRLEFIAASGALTAGQSTEMLGSDGVAAYLMFHAEL